MITRTVRIQLLAFLLVTIVGVSYVAVRYADGQRLFGATTYPVTMQLTNSGGIFTGADVTYRGVSVGRVGPLRLTEEGVAVQLDIDRSAPPIPADLDAAVSNLSGIGEQYVDLQPVSPDGPMLDSGSVIPASRTTTPVPVEDLVTSVDDLVRSVPLDSLRTVVDELGTAFNGTGPQLATLLDTSDAFTQDAVDTLPQTLTLIRDGRTVLQTQNEQASSITSFSADLALLAEQLETSDPDLRRLLVSGTASAEQIRGLLGESGSQLGVLVADLFTVSRIAEPRQAGLRQLLVNYPAIAAATDSSILPGDGTAHLGLALNLFEPPACTVGYEGTRQRPGPDITPAPPNELAYCAIPGETGINVRGAQNIPRGGAAPEPSTVGPAPGAPGAAPVPVLPLTSLASILEG